MSVYRYLSCKKREVGFNAHKEAKRGVPSVAKYAPSRRRGSSHSEVRLFAHALRNLLFFMSYLNVSVGNPNLF